MNTLEVKYCPGTLAEGHKTYSRTALRRLFNGRKVNHILPYLSPINVNAPNELFSENRKRVSISGVQEKFSISLEKNKLRLVGDDEQATYILKPIPSIGKNREYLPANEHLTMQIARQIFGIETAENALIFFKDGQPAYITKRFDVKADGTKWAKEDFASLAKRMPQTHGEHYKYLGSYLDLFLLMKKYLPLYKTEAPKLFKRLIFNYLFSNGDVHFKNFSLLETGLGDYRLSPAYDILNTRIHIQDADFALEDGLLPKNRFKRKVTHQFYVLGNEAELTQNQIDKIFDVLFSHSDKVQKLIQASYLSDKLKRNYLQAYQTKYNKLKRK